MDGAAEEDAAAAAAGAALGFATITTQKSFSLKLASPTVFSSGRILPIWFSDEVAQGQRRARGAHGAVRTGEDDLLTLCREALVGLDLLLEVCHLRTGRRLGE